MSRIRLFLHPYDLPLRRPWPASCASLERRRGWILELRDDDCRGFGECAPLPAAGTETVQEAGKQLSLLATGCADLAQAAARIALRAPAVSCGLETAFLDLEAHRQGLPLRRLLAASAADSFRVNSLSGSACSNGVEGAIRAGFDLVKLKVGHGDWKQELRCLQALAEELPRGTRLRLDANGAWDLATARRFLAEGASLPVESVEEPLAQPLPEQLESLQDETPIPLAIDESFHRLDHARLFARPPVKHLVLKPMALGGPRRALELAQRAVAAGMSPIVTSTLESAIGLHALCQLTAVVESLAPGQHHGLATADWFRGDLAKPPIPKRGRIHLDELPGLGVTA